MEKIKWRKLIVLIAMIFSCFMFLLIKTQEKATFSTERWLEIPEKRVEMIDDLLKSQVLIGKTKTEINYLLGLETKTEYFNEKNQSIYYLGDERGYISIDSEWLILTYSNDKVIRQEIKTD